jgi:amidase
MCGRESVRVPRRLMQRFALALTTACFLASAGAWSMADVSARSEPRAAGKTGQDVDRPFHLVEATIEDIHRAIRTRQITCSALVQAYVNRASAYNGVCTQLVTRDGLPVPPAVGATRAGAPIVFPTKTVAVSEVLPNIQEYSGLPLEFGRMEPTASDRMVQQQFGMIVGIANAGQLNALSTLNIRGERSVTCKAGCDVHPSSGALPSSCPSTCEQFRRQPDALERAGELDAQYGSNPDLEALPLYCIPFSLKDSFDTTDMRSTSGADVNYAMDAPPSDATLVTTLRNKGGIMLAKASLDEYNSSAGNPEAATPTSRFLGEGAHSTWAGTACNAYDTERVPGQSSSGSGPSVAANLVVCSICEDTGGSCRNPAAYNAVVGLLPTKGLLPYGGAIGSNPFRDRAGIHCRTVRDTALVLDALKDSQRGYFDSRDIHTALPTWMTSTTPYAVGVSYPHGRQESQQKPLAGIRIGVVREYMIDQVKNHAAINQQIDGEIRRVLRDSLGAELVESVDPLYADDASVPNMRYTFQHALAEIVPVHMPDYLSQKTRSGDLEFAVHGYDVTSPDYMVKAAQGRAPWPANLNLRRILSGAARGGPPESFTFRFHIAQYLLRRGDARVKDWTSLNANAKFHHERERLGFQKVEQNANDTRSDAITEQIKRREVLRLVLLKVMRENDIDVFVNPYEAMPVPKIGGAADPRAVGRGFGSSAGVPEVLVPAGFNRVVYEPQFVLTPDKKDYATVTGKQRSLMKHAMPISLSFWSGPGDERSVVTVAAAYEAATKHRTPPASFGPLQREP